MSVQLLALRSLNERGDRHQWRWDASTFGERLATIDSPLQLGSLLTPLNGAVFRRREGKRRLIFVPRRADDGTWQLVLVDVIDRRTGDRHAGEYRRLLDDTGRRRREYLRCIEREELEHLSSSPLVSRPTVPRLPSALQVWTRPMPPLRGNLEPVRLDDPSSITFEQLDGEQQDLLDGTLLAGTPRFLTGRAGSSKSTLLHHQYARYANLAIEQAEGWVPRFVTRNQHLLEDARTRVRSILLTEHGHEVYDANAVDAVNGWMSTTTELLRDVVLRSGGDHERWQPAGYLSTARFRELYLGTGCDGRDLTPSTRRPFKDFVTRRSVHWTEAWFVLRALIRGFDPARELDPEDYAELPRGDRMIPDDRFELVYERIYAPWYRELVTEGGAWDDQELARAAIARPPTETRVTAIVCDEAQDLSRVELLAILGTSELLRYDLELERVNCLPFVFAGDEAQTLDLTGFRWASITGGFYDLAGASFGEDGAHVINDDELHRNYRSSAEIVELANAIQQLRRERFGETGAQPQTAHRESESDAVALIDLSINQRAALVETLRTSDVILPCEEGSELEAVRSDDLLREAIAGRAPAWLETGRGVPPVYTAQALKGLELASAVLYGWGDALLAGEDRPTLARRTEHARWYVAVTRAVQRLTVLETPEGRPLWDALGLAEDILQERKLGAVEDAEGQLRARAVEARERGLRAQRATELFKAAQDFASLGDEREALESEAFAYRFDGDHLAAAERFLQLGRTEEAVLDLWRGRHWTRLAEAGVPRPEVAVGAMLTRPLERATVRAGSAGLKWCHKRAKEAGDPLDLVDDIARAAGRALEGDAPTAAALLDLLSDEPLLPRGRRSGLPALVANVTAVEFDAPAAAQMLMSHISATTRAPLARWALARLDRGFRHSFVAALHPLDPVVAATLGAEFGLTAPQPEPVTAGADETIEPDPPTASSTTRATPRTEKRRSSQTRSRPQPTSHGRVVPGQTWDGPRGTEIWKLSKKHVTLTRAADDRPLEQLVPADDAAAFISAALRIRPSGGRIWVDDEGVATTLVSGQLTILGVLPRRDGTRSRRSEDDRPALPKAPKPGARWTTAEDQWLLDAHQAGTPVDGMAEQLGRTPGAVRSRLTSVHGVDWRSLVEPDALARYDEETAELSNPELAKMLRELGYPPTGHAWIVAKHLRARKLPIDEVQLRRGLGLLHQHANGSRWTYPLATELLDSVL
jgi:hypothetical protein